MGEILKEQKLGWVLWSFSCSPARRDRGHPLPPSEDRPLICVYINSKLHSMVSCKIKPFLKDYVLIRICACRTGAGSGRLILGSKALNLSPLCSVQKTPSWELACAHRGAGGLLGWCEEFLFSSSWSFMVALGSQLDLMVLHSIQEPVHSALWN